MILNCKVENFDGDYLKIYKSDIIYGTVLVINKISLSYHRQYKVNHYIESYYKLGVKFRTTLTICMYSSSNTTSPYMFRLITPM